MDCGINCAECTDDSGECKKCIPDSWDGMYLVSFYQPKDCDFTAFMPWCKKG